MEPSRRAAEFLLKRLAMAVSGNTIKVLTSKEIVPAHPEPGRSPIAFT